MSEPASILALWRQRLLSLVTLGGLAAVGYVGHSTHWTFHLDSHGDPRAESHDSHPEPEDARPRKETLDSGAMRITFSSPQAMQQAGVTTAAVESRCMVEELACNGLLSYDERMVAQLSTRVTGTVWRVDKHQGQTVRKGETLALIESDEVGRLKAVFLNDLVSLESRTERVAALGTVKDAVTGRQLLEARSAMREAKIHLLNSEQALVNLGFEITADEFTPLADDERARRIRHLGLPAELTQADRGRLTSNLLPLRAPFDGVIIGRDVVVGEVVDPSRSTFELADVSRMWLTFDVSKEDARRVSLGQTMTFQPDGGMRELSTRIGWISTEVDRETRTLKIRGEVENPHWDDDVAVESRQVLRAQTFGTGRIVVRRNENARVVPQSSLHWDGTQHLIFVQVSDTVFESRCVAPGIAAEGFVEIGGEIPVGTRVASHGSHILKSEMLLSQRDRAH